MTYIPTTNTTVNFAEADADNPSVTDMLAEIAMSMRIHTHLLTKLVALTQGLRDPQPNDEADALYAEFLETRHQTRGMFN